MYPEKSAFNAATSPVPFSKVDKFPASQEVTLRSSSGQPNARFDLSLLFSQAPRNKSHGAGQKEHGSGGENGEILSFIWDIQLVAGRFDFRHCKLEFKNIATN